MEFKYRTHGTCSTQITLEIVDDKVYNVVFFGGCPGNLLAIPRLVEGMSCEEAIDRLSGICCGRKQTSCGDQLAQAIAQARQKAAQSE